jgi:hypothetical protein
MRVSGFTFVRNGTMLGYPFVESICSALPTFTHYAIDPKALRPFTG